MFSENVLIYESIIFWCLTVWGNAMVPGKNLVRKNSHQIFLYVTRNYL